MNHFLSQFKHHNGKYSYAKIFWEIFTFLSMLAIAIMGLFTIWSIATVFWNMVG